MCRTDQIVICSHNGEVSYLNTKQNGHLEQMTVLELKTYAVKTFPKSACSVGNIRLIVKDKPLDDDSASLSDYNIKSNCKVQMVKKVDGG